MIAPHLFLLLLTVYVSLAARSCLSSCNTTIVLSLPTKHLKIVQNVTLQVEITSVVGEVQAFIGYRAVRNVLVLNNVGIWPEINEKIHMVPSSAELSTWKTKGQCKIGRICVPNEHCWGSDAQICKDNGLTTWVRNSQFQYEDVDWNKDLFRTCIKEWECWTMKKTLKAIMSLTIGPVAILDGDELQLNVNRNTYIVKNQMAILVSMPNLERRKRTVDCLKHKTDTFCELDIGGTVQIFSFVGGSTCTALDTHKICITGNLSFISKDTLTTDKERGRPASMNDVMIIAEEMRASFVESMYNDVVMRGMLQNVMEVTNNLIWSSSRYNEMVIHDILGSDIHAQWTPFGIKTCPCLPTSPQSCRWTKSLLGTSKTPSSCLTPTGNEKIVNLYGEDNLKMMIPDHLILKAVGKTILETLEEKEMFEDKKAKLNSGSTTDGSVSFINAIGFSTIKDLIWHILPLINFLLIFLLLARSYR